MVGTYGYDTADRLTSVSWSKGGVIAAAAYTLDNVGNRTQRLDGLGTHTYSYDNLYRLTSVTYPGPSTDTYTYDAVGNRLTKNAATYTHDAADRLTATGGVSYGYDNNGNQITRGSDTYAWDAEDRMTSATVGGTSTTFAYNGDGLRNSRTVGGNTTTFTWDVAQSDPQVLDDGAFKYVYGLGRVAEIGPGTTTHYYLPGGLGSTMALVDSTGAIVSTYNYDIFGAIRSSTGSQANEFQFTGEQVDSSIGLQFLRARYYDTTTGRFVSKDPLSLSPTLASPDAAYSYASNNPTRFQDPSELDKEDDEVNRPGFDGDSDH
ncbi:MAG TPA: RHS repeat-associated core domain-containing protein [Dehalococcoidia bacterium]|nr:RHS repeat-associated core domain-containing protein [Dehalococcoidia bacterium]